MTHEAMAYISLAMFAMLFYRFSFIRFLAPMWIILFVLTSGYAVTAYGLTTIVMFAVVLMFFVLDEIRAIQKKAVKNRRNNQDDVVSIFNEDEDDETSGLFCMSALDDDESSDKPVKPKKSRLTVYEGTLLDCGFAPYKDIAGNDKSYFVDCDGEKVWAIGLKDAIKNCGAKIGDKVRFWKEAEVRTKKARVFDESGKLTGYRTLSQDKRRGFWVMEIVSD